MQGAQGEKLGKVLLSNPTTTCKQAVPLPLTREASLNALLRNKACRLEGRSNTAL